MQFKKSQLKALIENLPTFKLSAKASRGRQKIVNQMLVAHEELVKDIEELKKLEESEFEKEATDLLNEKITIDKTDIEHLTEALQLELEEYDSPLSGELAVIHDILLTELEMV